MVMNQEAIWYDFLFELYILRYTLYVFKDLFRTCWDEVMKGHDCLTKGLFEWLAISNQESISAAQDCM